MAPTTLIRIKLMTLPIDRRIGKCIRYIHTIKNYTAMEMNRLVTHATTWMNLANTTSNERSKNKNKKSMISLRNVQK